MSIIAEYQWFVAKPNTQGNEEIDTVMGRIARLGVLTEASPILVLPKLDTLRAALRSTLRSKNMRYMENLIEKPDLFLIYTHIENLFGKYNED